MAHTITVSISNGSVFEILERAQTEAQKFGVIFAGNEYYGRFTNNRNVDGNYQVSGNRVVVTVVRKPMLAPWSVVEQQIREFFSAEQNRFDCAGDVV